MCILQEQIILYIVGYAKNAVTAKMQEEYINFHMKKQEQQNNTKQTPFAHGCVF